LFLQKSVFELREASRGYGDRLNSGGEILFFPGNRDDTRLFFGGKRYIKLAAKVELLDILLANFVHAYKHAPGDQKFQGLLVKVSPIRQSFDFAGQLACFLAEYPALFGKFNDFRGYLQGFGTPVFCCCRDFILLAQGQSGDGLF
jgi:hypothetical protein